MRRCDCNLSLKISKNPLKIRQKIPKSLSKIPKISQKILGF